MTAISSVDPLLAALRAIHPDRDKTDDCHDDVEPPEPSRPHEWLFVATQPLPLPRTIRRAMAVVARDYDTSVWALQSPIRTAEVVLPRQIVMYLAKHRIGASLPAIGRVLGGRNHTTILHGIKRIEARLASSDVEFTERINRLIATIFPEDDDHDHSGN